MRQRGNRLTKTSVFLTKSQQIQKTKRWREGGGDKEQPQETKNSFQKMSEKTKKTPPIEVEFFEFKKKSEQSYRFY